MNYCKRGELLKYLNKLECFDEECSRFYAAEVTLALEYLHSKHIIHRYGFLHYRDIFLREYTTCIMIGI